jgi:hypothetical protein
MNDRLKELRDDLKHVLDEHKKQPFTDPQTLITVISLAVHRLDHLVGE